jgi:2-aminoethylphosphonate-pyruvate transaminase
MSTESDLPRDPQESDPDPDTRPAPRKRPRAPRYVLLNPGPVLTSEAVKSALAGADVCHRDSDYAELIERLEGKLLQVFGGHRQSHSVLLVTGSGTSALEAAISTFVPPGQKLLVASNGAFGERLQEIAAVHGVEDRPLRYDWGSAIEPQAVAARLEGDSRIFAVAMVHHETSVGILNPLREVGEVVARHGRLFFADCISSLGGEEIDVQRDHIDVCVACPNKCLHGVPGVAFVCVSRRVWDLVREVPQRSFYLDLRRYRHYQEDLRQPPFTPAVASFYALDQALEELCAQGVPERIRRYQELNALVQDGLTRLGMDITNNHGRGSHTITCIRVPEFIRFDDLYQELKASGFIVYNGKNELEGRVFQVANMGALTPETIQLFLERLGSVLARHRPLQEGAHV